MNDFPYTTTIARPGRDGGPDILKEYRWRVEEFDGRPRVVAEHRLFASELVSRWSLVRNPDTLAELLARTPR
jgi:hypothetical protein